ncbi:MAG: molybdopterin-guanine [Sphingomonas bacterium]|nr:molybdopterin-guanine [Sphingomonas bacterium]
MTRLGAIFAGGQARRFGGDKGAAEVGGRALIDRVADALRPQCDALVIVGRDWPGMARAEDLPEPGLGPLGALAGALRFAQSHGFEDVLTSGCDLPDIPRDLAARLAPGPAVVAGQPLLGVWPAALAARLLDHLETCDDRSMRGWIAAASARRVVFDAPIANINTRADLAAFATRPDLAD